MADRPGKRPRVRFTENFARNLEEVAAFLEEEGAGQRFNELLERSYEEVVPNLQSFPRLGLDFMARRLRSAQARVLHQRLAALAGPQQEVREYLLGEYLILYAWSPEKRAIILLAIKHHRQLSFDFGDQWD